MGKINDYPFVPWLLRPNLDQFTEFRRIGYVLLLEVNNMEEYVTTTYRLHDFKCNECYYEFISMYMYSLSVCRISVFGRPSWNVLCRGNHLSAGFADILRQISIPIASRTIIFLSKIN